MPVSTVMKPYERLALLLEDEGMPDDVATEEDLLAIAEARAEFERGETVSLEELERELSCRQDG